MMFQMLRYIVKSTCSKIYGIIKPIVDSDYIINLCKLKTHIMATFTGGTT
ncbi:DUF362 domain-containing protein [Clostridioides difficile]